MFPIERCLHAPRVYLRRLSKAHAAPFRDLLEKNRLWILPWMPEPPASLTLAEATRIIECEHQEAKRSQRLDLGIFRREGEDLIGRISLHAVQWGVSFSAGLGYWIDLDQAGRGFMTEAVATLVAGCFEELDFHRLWAGVQPANLPSQKVLGKLGFLREGTHRQELYINGRWRDQYYFTLLDSEFRDKASSWAVNRWLDR